MQTDEANFLGHMPTERMLKIRTKILKCILATDNAHHMDHTSKFAQRVQYLGDRPYEEHPALTDDSAADRQQLIEMTLHCADISNCCRAWDVNWRIGAHLEGEFFLQGDEEKRLKVPVMPLMNRETDSLAAGQGFWIPKIVVPLVQLFVPLLTEEAMATMRANCQSNQDHWAALLEKHGKQTAGELVKREYGYELPASGIANMRKTIEHRMSARSMSDRPRMIHRSSSAHFILARGEPSQ
jgi:hypothetical protein